MERSSEIPWPEYPRMEMKRDSFYNLNGTWEYQITGKDEKCRNDGEWKEIVVPYPLGTPLSRSCGELRPDQILWYRRTFSFRPDEHRTVLHFEAVDCSCEVYLNGHLVARHDGGYAPFSADISRWVKYQNALMVKVRDKSDEGSYAYGKQALHNGGMFYTPQAGIWQTVWIEKLPDHAVTDLRITPMYDEGSVHFDVFGSFHQAEITIFAEGEMVMRGLTKDGAYDFRFSSFHSWTPEDPFLYDVEIRTEDDFVTSYFGMRKFSSGLDARGMRRFMLNNHPYFFTGLLDQGYTPEGGFAYRDDETMRREILGFKKMGFNCLRKHVKVECRRWYYACDRIGMLVMQDMPSGGYDHYDQLVMGILPTLGMRRMKDRGKTKFGRKGPVYEAHYRKELDEMLAHLYNTVSLFAWVPFNEGWGQFDAVEITRHIQEKDRSRLVDSASGWFDQGCGDFLSIHDYFFPYHAKKREKRIQILSEFGGFSFIEKGHSFPKKLYGYRKYKDKAELNEAVLGCYEKMIEPEIKKGLSGCIYTQTADIEDECNGIFTADREVVKVDQGRMRRMNDRLKGKINER